MIQFCEQIAESISSYVDGAKEAPDGLDRASIEAHVRSCSYCGAEKRRLEKTRNALERGPSSGPPPRLWDSIERTLRNEGIIREP